MILLENNMTEHKIPKIKSNCVKWPFILSVLDFKSLILLYFRFSNENVSIIHLKYNT